MARFTGAWMKSKLKFLKNMDCPDQAKCFELLEKALDNEIDESKRDQFDLQIKNCMPCYKKYNLDSTIKEMLQTKIEVKNTPDGLIDSIKSKINDAK